MLQLNEQVFLLVLQSIDLVVDLHFFPFDHVESTLIFSKIELLKETLANIDRSIDKITYALLNSLFQLLVFVLKVRIEVDQHGEILGDRLLVLHVQLIAVPSVQLREVRWTSAVQSDTVPVFQIGRVVLFSERHTGHLVVVRKEILIDEIVQRLTLEWPNGESRWNDGLRRGRRMGRTCSYDTDR